MSKIQKTLLVIAFVVFIVLMAFLLYIVFFKPLTPAGPGNEGPAGANIGLPTAGTNLNIRFLPPGGGILPTLGNINANVNAPVVTATPPPSETAKGGLTKTISLSPGTASNPTIGPDGKYITYYDRSKEKFYKVNADGKIEELSGKTFHQVENVMWSPSKTSAILEYPDGANIYYDFSLNKQVTLPSHWQEFSFSPEGDRLINKSIGLSQENRYLTISNPEGTNIKIISNLGQNQDNVIPSWSPNNQMVAMVVGDVDMDQKEIFFVGLNNENFKSTFVEGWGFQGKWAPKGDKLLYSVYSARTEDKPELWIVDATADSMGRNRKNLKLLTWADKCTFSSSQTAYCAVPNNLQEGAGLFPDELDNEIDSVYRVDIVSGTKTLVAQPDLNHTMENLNVSDDGKYLYYTSKQDGKLYRIQLK